MTLTDIEDALNQAPFVPFDIHLDSGRILHVPHPDFLLFSADKRAAMVAEGDRFLVLDIERVNCLHFKRIET